MYSQDDGVIVDSDIIVDIVEADPIEPISNSSCPSLLMVLNSEQSHSNSIYNGLYWQARLLQADFTCNETDAMRHNVTCDWVRPIYKGQNELPSIVIVWDSNMWNWALTVQDSMGNDIHTRFTNDDQSVCPPKDGWMYWDGSTYLHSNLTVESYDQDSEISTSILPQVDQKESVKPTSGIIQSLHPYKSNEDQSWTINADCQNISVALICDTEQGYDHVKLGNITFSGNFTDYSVIPISSEISFTSDGSSERWGFSINWECADSDSIELDNDDNSTSTESNSIAIENVTCPSAITVSNTEYSTYRQGSKLLATKVVPP